MNLFAILLGGMAIKSVTDYPPEIRDLKRQLPKSERNEFLNEYKKLSSSAKTDFKTALRNADIKAASQILGEDLTKYNIVLKKTDGTDSASQLPQSGTDIINKVNKLINVPTSIDPELYAEAARRYEEAVPSNSNLSITEKTSRLIETSV